MNKLVIVINGFTTKGIELRHLEKLLLKEEGYDVYLPIIPTMLKEDKTYEKVKISQFDDFLEELYESHGKKYDEVIMCGFSLGANVALAYARKYPVEKICLIAPVFVAPNPVRALKKVLLGSRNPKESSANRFLYNYVFQNLIAIPKSNIFVAFKYTKLRTKEFKEMDYKNMFWLIPNDDIAIHTRKQNKILKKFDGLTKVYESNHMMLVGPNKSQVAKDIIKYIKGDYDENFTKLD